MERKSSANTPIPAMSSIDAGANCAGSIFEQDKTVFFAYFIDFIQMRGQAKKRYWNYSPGFWSNLFLNLNWVNGKRPYINVTKDRFGPAIFNCIGSGYKGE